ncbi:hypothetical protein LTR70_010427 [Exophiala xenobiotica]|uniref:Uncharacterized protein n=1 Tax=Lithohypha guttulata TaxID=1690604 RepID=A0ABR0JUX4_9EURO|nr:hypothetical protein LTR24_010401 [Lithohypha guttulata]KAK5309283.1 hypothetical protein LTR70_010427 [Exophiala xenobiotica]
MDPVLPLDIIDMIAQKCVGPFTISVTLSRLTLPSTSKLRVQRIPPAPLRLRDVCKAFDRGVLLGLRDQFDRHLRIAPNSFKETAIYRATMASSSSKCRGNWLYRPPHGSETGLQVSSYNREHHTLAAPYAMDNPNEVQLRGKTCYHTLKRGSGRLTMSFRQGIQITPVREVNLNYATLHRTWHKISTNGPELLSAKTIHLLPWKEQK